MRKIIILCVAVSFYFTSYAQYNYPVTKTVDSSDTYFGHVYKDPYRWLEYIEKPEVETWFKQQADFTNSILDKINGRDELIAEWKQLDKIQPPMIWNILYENGRIFYRKRMPGENVAKLYYRVGIKGQEILLFDPQNYITGKKYTLEDALPSHDGSKIAICYSEQGAEVSTLKIMDVDKKLFLKDSIYPASISSWSFDDKTVLYSWIQSVNNKDPQSRLNPKTKLHKIGYDVNTDVDFFSNASYPELKIEANVFPFAFLNEDSKNYIFAGTGSVQPELIMYYAPIEQFNSKRINWKVLCKPSDKVVRNIVIIEDDAYAITYNNAKNYKVISTNLQHPDWSNAISIAPEKKDQTIESITNTKDYLLIVYSDGINNHLWKYSFKTKTIIEVKLPFLGTIGINCMNTKTNNCELYITSWNQAFTDFNFDAVTDIFTASSFNKPAFFPAAYKNLQVEEVMVKGHDGVMIPLSIIYKKGMRLDGSNVCLLDAYGAYGISMTPYFNYMENSLAIKGVVYAIPHVRGGSEKGDEWYKAGYKTTKPNTWKDFNSCAEYLITKGYTSKGKIAGTGTSAGGILISRAITERPDLYAAAICNVGVANAMRFEFCSNGPANIPEFGTVKDSIECKALYEMDGMQHVVNGTKYPAVICVGGWNDPRVISWEPGKFAAALQNASTSGKPVLMKVNYDNGHFTQDKNITFANFANQFSFVLWQCGHPDFQLKKQKK